VELDDGLTVTEAQWIEHTETWRLAHLDRAPSAYLRQLAISGQQPAAEQGTSRGQTWASLPHLGLEMMVVAAIVAIAVIATAFH
jgi:hypothetical protein